MENRIFRATDARQLLENPLFVKAWEALESYLHMQALSCDPDNAEKSRRIVISLQLLAGVKREITRVVEDGKVAEIQLKELETKKKSIFQR